ncbi:MliC family protein [Alteromonas oceanisediminis]|uniref:MliC family protein n=1 Tax=Alteromonas oceanisediminis TaxID=2836180 RepID=UPI001BDAC698|nr:MliC family protein [Alteromonas oceanisediminis]MBT0586959.1 MliC family protein [Alteromonas oceanisediminis]
MKVLKRHVRVLAPLLVIAAMSGCSNQPRTEYYCDNGERAGVIYLSEAAGSGAILHYQGQDYEMYPTRTASGAKYATEQGLSPEEGLIWWTQGESAMLMTMILDHTVSAEDYPMIARCELL